MTEWFFKLTMYIYTNTKCSATLSCFLQQLTMRYKIETNKSNTSGELSTFIMNWFWYVSITTEKKKTDNFSVDVIYFRFWIVYTCGMPVSQSVQWIAQGKYLSVTVYNVRVRLLVCMSVCLRDCVPFRIIIMCAQTVHLCIIMSFMHC